MAILIFGVVLALIGLACFIVASVKVDRESSSQPTFGLKLVGGLAVVVGFLCIALYFSSSNVISRQQFDRESESMKHVSVAGVYTKDRDPVMLPSTPTSEAVTVIGSDQKSYTVYVDQNGNIISVQ